MWQLPCTGPTGKVWGGSMYHVGIGTSISWEYICYAEGKNMVLSKPENFPVRLCGGLYHARSCP